MEGPRAARAPSRSPAEPRRRAVGGRESSRVERDLKYRARSSHRRSVHNATTSPRREPSSEPTTPAISAPEPTSPTFDATLCSTAARAVVGVPHRQDEREHAPSLSSGKLPARSDPNRPPLPSPAGTPGARSVPRSMMFATLQIWPRHARLTGARRAGLASAAARTLRRAGPCRCGRRALAVWTCADRAGRTSRSIAAPLRADPGCNKCYTMKPGVNVGMKEAGWPRQPRVLWVTRIFPNRVEPLSCAFQRQQLAALSRRCAVEVLAVIPYHPGVSPWASARVGPAGGGACARRDRRRPGGPRARRASRGGPVLAPVNAPLYLAGLRRTSRGCGGGSMSCWGRGSTPTPAPLRCSPGCSASLTR